mgnify:CR=1 FL=1
MDVGVIGTGQMGRNHVRVYSEIKPVSSVYIYDLNDYIESISVDIYNVIDSTDSEYNSISELIKSVS